MIDTPEVATTVPADFDDPPSLRRMGPSRFDLADERGCRPTLRGSGFQLSSGHRYTVRVRPQAPDDFGRITRVIVEESDCLPTVVPALEAVTKAGQEYTSILRPRRPYFLPAKAGLTVTLHHDRWGPFSLTLPVVVWPGVWSQLSLALTVPLAAAVHRLSSRLAIDGSTVRNVLREEIQDPTFWLQSFLFGMLTLVALKSLSHCWAFLGTRTD